MISANRARKYINKKNKYIRSCMLYGQMFWLWCKIKIVTTNVFKIAQKAKAFPVYMLTWGNRPLIQQ